jgi:hypothetical protein
MLALGVQAALAGCTLDVHGLEALDSGIVGGDDAGMSVTIPDTGPPPPPPMEASVPPPDASAPDVMMVVGKGCPDGATVKDIMGPLPDNTGNFGTTGPACARFRGNVMGWGVSNGQGRMVTIVGATTMGPFDATATTTSTMAPGSDGFIYWLLTSGSADYVSVYAY